MMMMMKGNTKSNNNNDDDANDASPLFDLLFSQYHVSALLIFGRHGYFDYIDSFGAKGVSVDDLATHASWSTRATSAMLLSLVTCGICQVVTADAEDNNGKDDLASSSSSAVHSYQHCYALTPRAQTFLLSNAPGAVTPYFELFWETSPQALLAKAAADKPQENFMLETGGEGGAPSSMFINAMQGQTSHAATVLAPMLNLQDSTHFVDVGGGSGTFCIQACQAFAQLKGSVYELAGVCPLTTKYIEKANMKDRIQALAGNMLQDEVFPSADVYAFGNVLHDWPDETNLALLNKAYKSLPDTHGKVVLLEMLIAEDVTQTSSAAAGLNLVMVTNEDGRQYKANELKTMLQKAGFTQVQVVSSPLTPYSAIIASKE